MRVKEQAQSWIANLYPEPGRLLNAPPVFFPRAICRTGQREGLFALGPEKTRLGAEEVGYLETLFPASTILLLVRNPVDAWASYSQMGELWYASFPTVPLVSAADFARHWERLASGMYSYAPTSPRCLLLRYEDLVPGGKRIGRDRRPLGTDARSVGVIRTFGWHGAPFGLSVGCRQARRGHERRAPGIARIAGGTALKFGYRL